MAEGTVPIFTVNDFPNEIIEKFAPNNWPKTISNLRLVSRRFRDVFCADHFYRSYLWYSHTPEKYRKDLEEIGDKPNRLKLCLEAEKQRFENWRNGQPTRVDRIKIESHFSYTIPWQGKTGDNGELWLLAECEGSEGRILLSNVTKSPVLTEIAVSSYTRKQIHFATLLPDRVIIADSNGSNHVFDIQNNGSKPSLEYKFNIQSSGNSVLFISGKSTETRALRSLCVSYTRIDNFCPNADTVLRVWDVKTGAELERIDLWQLLSPRCAQDFRDTITALRIKTTEFPYVVVKIWYGRSCNILSVINVEEGRVVLYFEKEENVHSYHNDVWMSGNTACVSFKKYTTPNHERELRVYDLGMRPNFEDKTGILYEFSTTSGYYEIHYKFPMLHIETYDMIKSVAIDRLEVFEREISREVMCGTSSTPIEPFIVNERIGGRFSSRKLSTWDTLGRKLFDWDELLPKSDVDAISYNKLHLSRVDFLDLSNYIVHCKYSENGHCSYLYIFKF